MGLEVLLVVLALVPLGALLGLYLYITHGARSSHQRRRRRNRRALKKARQRSARVAAADPDVADVAGVAGVAGVAEDRPYDNYLDQADPSDAYFEEAYLDEDDGGALARGLLEDEVDISQRPDDHADPDTDR